MNRIFRMAAAGVMAVAGGAMGQPDSLWSRTYGGEGNDRCFSVLQATNGDIILGGFTYSFGNGESDFWMLRIDENGDSISSRTYGGDNKDACYSIIETSDGGFAWVGSTSSFGAGRRDCWLLKTDENGDSLWSRTFGGERDDYCNSIVQMEDGGFALAGNSISFNDGSGEDFWLVRTDENGDGLWSRTYDRERQDFCNSFLHTSDGGFALAGLAFDGFGGVGWLLRTDESGEELWSRTFNIGFLSGLNSIVQTANGEFVLAGAIGAPDSLDCWLARLDQNGEEVWRRTVENSRNSGSEFILSAEGGGFVMAGIAKPSARRENYYLVKVDDNGDSLWTREFQRGGERNLDYCRSVVQLSNGRFLLVGETGDENALPADDFDYLVIMTGDDTLSAPRSDFMLQPSALTLYPAYPNPFNARTVTSYKLQVPSIVRLGLFDMAGREVAILQEGAMQSGEHRLEVNAEGLAAGEYVVRLKAAGEEASRAIMLLK